MTLFQYPEASINRESEDAKKIAIKGKRNKHKQTNKQYTGTEDLLKIFAINDEHVALISVNAVFSFYSHRHGSVFRCFSDSLFFWRLSGNNHLTSATKRVKVKRLMPGKKCIKI